MAALEVTQLTRYRDQRHSAIMPSPRRLLLLVCFAVLLTVSVVDAKKKKKKKKKSKGKTSVSYGDAEKDGFQEGESDEEFLMRLTGSSTPQSQRIVTGVDPRKKPEAEATVAQGNGPTEKELEGKRNSHLFKMGSLAKEMGEKWESAGQPTTLFPDGDTARRDKMAVTLAETAGIEIVPKGP